MAESLDQVLQNGDSNPRFSPSTLNGKLNGTHNPARQSRVGSLRKKPHFSVKEDCDNPNGMNISRSYTPSNVSIHEMPIMEDEVVSRPTQSRGRENDTRPADAMMDFFGAEVFQIVLHNPTTAYRFLKFCQSRACGENMEFLEKVDTFYRVMDEATRLLSDIHTTYTSVDAPRQINISYPLMKRITSDIKVTTQSTIPAMERIFAGAQDDVERLLASDIYPRFVKHQITTSATVALGDDKSRYQGLGDCFCLTDPSVADNPIVFASDGFVDVTGYSRRDIVPRNCRFLQGPLTDKNSTKRLRQSIENAEETVELLLNYRKDGEPFWNLLYVAPLYDQHGNVAFFLGGQINCSTTIHSRTDILKILSLNDEGVPDRRIDYDNHSLNGRPNSEHGGPGSTAPSMKTRSSFFKSFRRQRDDAPNINVRPEVGMEGELINKLGKLSLRTQVEAFYTAYSKYLVLKYSPTTSTFTVSHFSPSSIDLLCLNLPNGSIAPIFNKDIFSILSTHSTSSSTHKALKVTVRENIKKGKAVSVEMGLMTGFAPRRGGFNGRGEKRIEEKYIGHWTPLKDEEGRAGWVVLTIAPK